MIWNIKDNGESIEKLASKWLEKGLIHEYNKFWGKYIGNINGKPAEISGLSQDKNRDRLLIGQWNYTLLCNLVVLYKLKKEIKLNPKMEEGQKVLQSIRNLNETIHVLYNSNEIVDKFNKKMYCNIKTLDPSLINYRNIIAHDIRYFIKIGKTELMVPSMSNDFNNKKDFIWSLDEPSNLEYVFLSDFVNKSYEIVKQMLYDLLSQSCKLLAKDLDNKTIPEYESLTIPKKLSTHASGSTNADF